MCLFRYIFCYRYRKNLNFENVKKLCNHYSKIFRENILLLNNWKKLNIFNMHKPGIGKFLESPQKAFEWRLPTIQRLLCV